MNVGNCKIIVLQNINVASSAWASDNTYSGFPYRASISCSGVTSSYVADVIFSPTDAISCNFAPVCQTGTDVVYIYAMQIPTTTITIQTIEARKAVD